MTAALSVLTAAAVGTVAVGADGEDVLLETQLMLWTLGTVRSPTPGTVGSGEVSRSPSLFRVPMPGGSPRGLGQ